MKGPQQDAYDATDEFLKGLDPTCRNLSLALKNACLQTQASLAAKDGYSGKSGKQVTEGYNKSHGIYDKEKDHSRIDSYRALRGPDGRLLPVKPGGNSGEEGDLDEVEDSVANDCDYESGLSEQRTSNRLRKRRSPPSRGRRGGGRPTEPLSSRRNDSDYSAYDYADDELEGGGEFESNSGRSIQSRAPASVSGRRRQPNPKPAQSGRVSRASHSRSPQFAPIEGSYDDEDESDDDNPWVDKLEPQRPAERRNREPRYVDPYDGEDGGDNDYSDYHWRGEASDDGRGRTRLRSTRRPAYDEDGYLITDPNNSCDDYEGQSTVQNYPYPRDPPSKRSNRQRSRDTDFNDSGNDTDSRQRSRSRSKSVRFKPEERSESTSRRNPHYSREESEYGYPTEYISDHPDVDTRKTRRGSRRGRRDSGVSMSDY